MDIFTKTQLIKCIKMLLKIIFIYVLHQNFTWVYASTFMFTNYTQFKRKKNKLLLVRISVHTSPFSVFLKYVLFSAKGKEDSWEKNLSGCRRWCPRSNPRKRISGKSCCMRTFQDWKFLEVFAISNECGANPAIVRRALVFYDGTPYVNIWFTTWSRVTPYQTSRAHTI